MPALSGQVVRRGPFGLTDESAWVEWPLPDDSPMDRCGVLFRLALCAGPGPMTPSSHQIFRAMVDLSVHLQLERPQASEDECWNTAWWSLYKNVTASKDAQRIRAWFDIGETLHPPLRELVMAAAIGDFGGGPRGPLAVWALPLARDGALLPGFSGPLFETTVFPLEEGREPTKEEHLGRLKQATERYLLPALSSLCEENRRVGWRE